MGQSEATPLYLAAKNGHADIVDSLLSNGECDFVLTDCDETPLHVAVKRGHTKVVEVILKYSRRIFEELTNDGHEHQENVKNLSETNDIIPIQLLNSDYDRCILAGVALTGKRISLELLRNSDGFTALDLAVRSAKPEMVQLFLNGDRFEYSEHHLRAGFDNLVGSNNFNLDRLYNYEKDKEIARALLNSNEFNVNHQNRRGENPLHEVVAFIGLFNNVSAKNINTAKRIANDVMQMLLEKGADCNLKTFSGETPIIIASERSCCDAIKILFDWEKKSEIKLDLDARDKYGETALMKAARSYHVSVVQMLLSHGASVNLYDNCGFTALHAAILDDVNEQLFDLHYFCKGLLKRKFNLGDSVEIWPKWRNKTLDSHAVIDRQHRYLERSNEIIRLQEDVVNLLLDDNKINVNAMDFIGNTPLDLAVASSKRITSPTIESLRNCSATRKLLEPEYKAPTESAVVDERGRNPLHRLIISIVLDYVDAYEEVNAMRVRERFNLMVSGILLRPEKFRHLATATDDKGRTPLHYVAMSSRGSDKALYEWPYTYIHTYLSQSDSDFLDYELINLLMKLGSNVNATDMYGKTPLHYSEMKYDYERLVQYGADENTKDNNGHTPEELRQLRKSVKGYKMGLSIGDTYRTLDSKHVFNTKHVKKLTNHRLVEAICIYPRSPGLVSSEEAVWNIWGENECFFLNERVRRLKPSIHQFIERLADGIKKMDGRFECQPILVGSADEGTQVITSADFDFNFQLIKLSKLCEVSPHPLGPKGYFQLRRKSNEYAKKRIDEEFDSFFNSDQCMLTNEVNSRFKILLGEVLSDPALWKGEHHFDWNVENACERNRNPFGLCTTLHLKMINPIADGEDGLFIIDISIDIVASVQVTDWWPDDPLPVGISPDVKANGSTFVFDRPRFDPTQPNLGECPFSETFARISFAPIESRIIKECSPLIKAAYIVCKRILDFQQKTTYPLKTCLLFCMEALNPPSNSETKNEYEYTPTKLAFWVERIMFCFMEFSRHRVYPCYFMPSFRQLVLVKKYDTINLGLWGNKLTYMNIFVLCIELFPEDAAIDIPIAQLENCLDLFDPTDIQVCKEFDREEIIRKLSSRSMPIDK